MKGTFGALAELRARLFWRRLTGRGGLAEGVALAVLFLVALPLGLVFAGLIGAGSWRAARAGPGLTLDVSLAAIFFGLWQTWTAVSLALADRDGADLRRFLVYPLPPGRVYLLGLGSGIAADPVGLVWALLLGGIFAGAAAARPGTWLLALAVTLALFAAATVFLVALVQELLALLMRRRWLREIAVGLAVAAGVALALAAGLPRAGASFRQVLSALAALKWLAWPAALAWETARRLYAGAVGPGLPWLAALAAASAATGWLSYRLALAAARSGGDGGGETGAARPADGWRLWPWRGPFAALLEKEGKYLLRHPLARVYALMVPAFAAVIAWRIAPRIPVEAGEVVRALPLFGFAVYTHLALQVFWLNGFGWDRGGARSLYLAPVDLAEVLLAKNLAVHALSSAVFLAAAGLMLALGGGVPAWALAGALALHAGLAPAFYGLGNLVGVLNPRAAPFAVQRNGSLSWLSGLAGMGIISGASGLFALPVLLALRLESPWLVPSAWAALGAAGYWAYRRSLPAAARLLAERRDAFLPAVCGDDA